MKFERTKNAARNMFYEIILRIYQLIIPFVLRTILIYYLGIEYAGVSSLFVSILSMLNLAELGVGSAMVFSMYKPVVEDDEATICALMGLYRKYYRIIGMVILMLGLVLAPFVPKLVHGDVPRGMNLLVLYFMNLAVTVLSYWLFAYKNCLLTAHQRRDIASKITLIVNTITYIAQFVILCVFRDYYLYTLATIIAQIAVNCLIANKSNKMFPKYSAKGTLDKVKVKEINSRIKDLFIARLGGTITDSADTIVISSFLGLGILGIYNNYFCIISALIGMLRVSFTACTAGIGNSLITETKEKNYKDFEKITFLVMWSGAFCTSCLIGAFQPFMKVWMGENKMLSYSIVICLGIYFFVYEINAYFNLYKDAAGIWHQDRFRPLVVSMTNLFMNLATIKYLGLYGVVLSTIISMAFIGIPWVASNLFNNIFERSSIKRFGIIFIKYLVQVVIVVVTSCYLCSLINLNGWLDLIVKLVVCGILSNTIFFVLNFKNGMRKDVSSMLKRLLKR